MLRLASARALLVVISLTSYQVSADLGEPSFSRPKPKKFFAYPKYQPLEGRSARVYYREFRYDVQEAIWDALDAARRDPNGDHAHIDYSEFSSFMVEFYTKRMDPDTSASNEHLSETHKRALFRIYDKDHNNKLNLKEAVVGFLQHQEFFFFDIDYNGKLSKKELLAMHDSPHLEPTTGKYFLSGDIDFLELFQRMLSHNKLPMDWEKTMGAVPANINN